MEILISKMFLPRSVLKLLEINQTKENIRFISNKSALLSTIRREKFLRTYPVIIVQPDGSTIRVKYPEPRRIIKLPLDLSSLDEAERQKALEKRKPPKKFVVEEEIEDTFSSKDYIKYIKQRKAQ